MLFQRLVPVMEEQQHQKEEILVTDLGAMVKEDGYEGFSKAMALAFDIDYQLARDFCNYDLVRTASIPPKTGPGLNYSQWLCNSDKKLPFFRELFAFLFDYRSYDESEPWQHSEATKNRLRKFVIHLVENYEGDAKKYFQSWATRLWLHEHNFIEDYDYCVKKAEKMITTYKEGGNYLYSYFDYENRIVYYGK